MIDTTPPTPTAPTVVGTAVRARPSAVTRAARDGLCTANSRYEWGPYLSEWGPGTARETTGADANSGPENVPPLRCDAAEPGQQNTEPEDDEPGDVEQGGLTDATWAVFLELLPRFEGLLPPTVVLDCVQHAVQDLLASISVEALPEMAVRLAGVRLERHRLIYQPPDAWPADGAADRSIKAQKAVMIGPGPAYIVIRRPTPECPLVAVTVTTTRSAS